MPTFAPKQKPAVQRAPSDLRGAARSASSATPKSAGSQLRWQYHHSAVPKLQRGTEITAPEVEEAGAETPVEVPPEAASLFTPEMFGMLTNHFGQPARRGGGDEPRTKPRPQRTVPSGTVDALTFFFCNLLPMEGICSTLRACDEDPEPCDAFVRKILDIFDLVFCNPPCEQFDLSTFRCVPRPPVRCQCLDLEEARQFAITKLSQTGAYVGRWAAAMQAGAVSFAMPSNLKAELTKGAETVVDRLKAKKLNPACDPGTPSGNVGQYVHPNDILLTPISTSPPWTQTLLNRVVLHETLHAVCNHLPSGGDPYDQAVRLGVNPNTVMHEDLLSIMKAFPDDTPKW